MKLPFKIKGENYRRGLFQVGVFAVATGFVRAFGGLGVVEEADGIAKITISLLGDGSMLSSIALMFAGIVLIFASGIYPKKGDDDDNDAIK